MCAHQSVERSASFTGWQAVEPGKGRGQAQGRDGWCEVQRCLGTHPHLLVSVLGRVLAALALPPQLLQLGLALLQTLPFALVLHLVFLQGGLQGAAHSQPGEIIHRENNKENFKQIKFF